MNGAINTSQALSPIIISLGQSSPPSATSSVELDMNLDASDTSLAPATGNSYRAASNSPTAGRTRYHRGNDLHLHRSSATLTAPDTVLIGPRRCINSCRPGGRHHGVFNK